MEDHLIFALARDQCKDNMHCFWWEFNEDELLLFAECIAQLAVEQYKNKEINNGL